MIVIKQLIKKYKEKEILFHINEYIFNDGIYEIKGKSGTLPKVNFPVRKH